MQSVSPSPTFEPDDDFQETGIITMASEVTKMSYLFNFLKLLAKLWTGEILRCERN
jgi:hypothetical protein